MWHPYSESALTFFYKNKIFLVIYCKYRHVNVYHHLLMTMIDYWLRYNVRPHESILWPQGWDLCILYHTRPESCPLLRMILTLKLTLTDTRNFVFKWQIRVQYFASCTYTKIAFTESRKKVWCLQQENYVIVIKLPCLVRFTVVHRDSHHSSLPAIWLSPSLYHKL